MQLQKMSCLIVLESVHVGIMLAGRYMDHDMVKS